MNDFLDPSILFVDVFVAYFLAYLFQKLVGGLQKNTMKWSNPPKLFLYNERERIQVGLPTL